MPIEVKGDVFIKNTLPSRKTGPESNLHEKRTVVRKALKSSLDDGKTYIIRDGKIKEIGKKSKYLLDQLEIEEN